MVVIVEPETAVAEYGFEGTAYDVQFWKTVARAAVYELFPIVVLETVAAFHAIAYCDASACSMLSSCAAVSALEYTATIATAQSDAFPAYVLIPRRHVVPPPPLPRAMPLQR